MQLFWWKPQSVQIWWNIWYADGNTRGEEGLKYERTMQILWAEKKTDNGGVKYENTSKRNMSKDVCTSYKLFIGFTLFTKPWAFGPHFHIFVKHCISCLFCMYVHAQCRVHFILHIWFWQLTAFHVKCQMCCGSLVMVRSN